jgi:hypothetical protein
MRLSGQQSNAASKIPLHRRKPVPMAEMGPGLRLEDEDVPQWII